MRYPKIFVLWTVLLVFGVTPVLGQSSYSPAKRYLDGFGGSAVVGADEVIVGSIGPTANPGELYIFRKSGGDWKEAGRIAASDGMIDNRFGRALAIHEGTLLVGSTGQNDSQGAAYIFEKEADGDWVESARLKPSREVGFWGRAVALNDQFAFVATVASDSAAGSVYVFERNARGKWKEHSILTPSDPAPGNYFGLSLSLVNKTLLVGAPALEREDATGSAYIFEFDEEADAWKQHAQLRSTSGQDQYTAFGFSVVMQENYAVIGEPGINQATGRIHVFVRDGESGTWRRGNSIVPFDATAGMQFGSSVGINDDGIWVGAPLASQGVGASYLINYDFEANLAERAVKLHAGRAEYGSRFGSFLTIGNDLAVIGSEAADSRLGAAYVFAKNDNEVWEEEKVFYKEVEGLKPVRGAEVECAEGKASLFDCEGVDLISFMPVRNLGGGRKAELNDIWGWTDPETGTEYVLLGRTDGTSFIDISEPTNPILVGTLPITKGSDPSHWRDIKVYKDHAYIVADGAGKHGMQVFDLTQLRSVEPEIMPVDFELSALYDEVASVHNIAINEETGYAFALGSTGGGKTCGGGLHMINIQEPLKPTFAGCFADRETGESKTGYTHDAQCVIYSGPDADYKGKEICFGSNETALSIADVTDKENPMAISNATYPNVGYTHQGWLTEDQRFFFMGDEYDELTGAVSYTRTMIWDVQDLEDPQLVKEFFQETTAYDHNLYIKGDVMYQSNYNAGLRIYDISDIENPQAIGHFDTNPFDNGGGFNGSWSNYPYFESGVIAVSSIEQGLFLLKKSNIDI